MSIQDPWHDIRFGKAEYGLKVFADEFSARPDASHAVQLGVGYLWVRKYGEALRHFRKIIEEYPRKADVYFGMAGVAAWCGGKPELAVALWSEGVEAKYADSAGGIGIPLLLFAASVMKPGVFAPSKVRRILESKAGDGRAVNWPGPLAKFVVGLFGRGEVLECCKGRNDRTTEQREWLFRFYEGVSAFADGDVMAFRQKMGEVCDTEDLVGAKQDLFLSRVWTEEFFIARHESI